LAREDAGGMGEVYYARDTLAFRDVAVKILSADLVDNSSAIERFKRESQLTRNIDHENICPVLDSGILPSGRPYLIMPYLMGTTFYKILQEEELSIRRLVNIICRVLSGLSAAHNKNIVHRDLKPSNIFIIRRHRKDKGDRVQIIDFGISKSLSLKNQGITKTGVIIGTSAYMSPEQATGEKVDLRTDIWAAGVILYQVLTGGRPFESDSQEGVREKIISAPFKHPRNIKPSISKHLEEVVLTAMARNRTHRYSSAGQMRTALIEAFIRAENPNKGNTVTDATSRSLKRPFGLEKERDKW